MHVGAAGHEAQAVRVAELTVPVALLAPLLHPLASAIEQCDAAVHVAVRHVKRSVRANRNVGGLIEMRRIPFADTRLAHGEDPLAVVRVLEHLLQPHVGEEDVVLIIDGDAVRHEKRVGAPRTDQLSAGAVDLEHRRILQQLGGRRVEAPSGPVKHEHVAVAIDGHTGGFAHLDARRKRGPALDLFVANAGLGDGRGSTVTAACGDHQTRHDDRENEATHSCRSLWHMMRLILRP